METHDPTDFSSPSEWYRGMKNADYSVPVQAGDILSTLMRKEGINFQEAYNKAISDGGIVLRDKTYIADLGYLSKLKSQQ